MDFKVEDVLAILSKLLLKGFVIFRTWLDQRVYTFL